MAFHNQRFYSTHFSRRSPRLNAEEARPKDFNEPSSLRGCDSRGFSVCIRHVLLHVSSSLPIRHSSSKPCQSLSSAMTSHWRWGIEKVSSFPIILPPVFSFLPLDYDLSLSLPPQWISSRSEPNDLANFNRVSLLIGWSVHKAPTITDRIENNWNKVVSGIIIGAADCTSPPLSVLLHHPPPPS